MAQRRARRRGPRSPAAGGFAVDALIARSIETQVQTVLDRTPRAEREYLRVHMLFRFPEPTAPLPPPFHARISARSAASKAALARAVRGLKARWLATGDQAASCRLDIAGHRALAFRSTVGGYLNATRCLFVLEDVPGVTVRYVRGRRP